MILTFGVSNSYSVCDWQELSFVAAAIRDDNRFMISTPELVGENVLPVLVIYGANASGKSNILKSLNFVRQAVKFSHRKGEPEGGVDREPFRLSTHCSSQESLFQIRFVLNDIRYDYEFGANDEEFTRENLYYYPNGRKSNLYKREKESFSFGRNLKGPNKMIAKMTRNNSLYLSCAAQNEHEMLSSVSKFIRNIGFDSNISIEGGLAARALAEGGVDSRAIKLLNRIGTGIVDYRTSERVREKFEVDLLQGVRKVMEGMSDGPFQTELFNEIENKENLIEMSHLNERGEKIYFDLNKESAGTKRLLMLLGKIFSALDDGSVLVVDELDASLHTHACEEIVSLFSSRETNPNGAQLLATTHDTNLLCSRFLRRDQIWFTEKDESGATHLYPLTDIRTRKGDNIERGYLQGRFGAIPVAGLDSTFAAH